MPESNPRLGENTDSSALRILFISIAAMAGLVVLVIVLMGIFRHKGSPPDFRDPRYVTVTDDATDQAALDAMRRAGADLTKPTRITHSLYMPSKTTAQWASDDLSQFGYEVKTTKAGRSRPDQALLLQAEKTAVPTTDYFRDSRNRFNALAVQWGGDYTGWTAAITK